MNYILLCIIGAFFVGSSVFAGGVSSRSLGALLPDRPTKTKTYPVQNFEKATLEVIDLFHRSVGPEFGKKRRFMVSTFHMPEVKADLRARKNEAALELGQTFDRRRLDYSVDFPFIRFTSPRESGENEILPKLNFEIQRHYFYRPRTYLYAQVGFYDGRQIAIKTGAYEVLYKDKLVEHSLLKEDPSISDLKTHVYLKSIDYGRLIENSDSFISFTPLTLDIHEISEKLSKKGFLVSYYSSPRSEGERLERDSSILEFYRRLEGLQKYRGEILKYSSFQHLASESSSQGYEDLIPYATDTIQERLQPYLEFLKMPFDRSQDRSVLEMAPPSKIPGIFYYFDVL